MSSRQIAILAFIFGIPTFGHYWGKYTFKHRISTDKSLAVLLIVMVIAVVLIFTLTHN